MLVLSKASAVKNESIINNHIFYSHTKCNFMVGSVCFVCVMERVNFIDCVFSAKTVKILKNELP